VDQRQRLAPADLADDQTIRQQPERRLDQRREVDLGVLADADATL